MLLRIHLKILLLFILSSFFSTTLQAQNCITSSITLSTQSAVDNFPSLYPGCSHVNGTIFISGSNSDPIKNLDSLYVISKIDAYLTIQNNDSLQNLNGFKNLLQIGEGLRVRNNPLITNFDGFRLLDSIGNYLRIENNPRVQNIDSLQNLILLSNYLRIENNDSLLSLNGLENLDSIGGYIFIQNNSLLNSIESISNLNLVNLSSLLIGDNENLAICSYSNICSYVSLNRNTTNVFRNAEGCISRNQIQLGCYGTDTIYVDSSAVGNETGLNWADAYSNLQEALVNLDSVEYEGQIQIWVAKGTYFPTSDNNRDSSFLIQNGTIIIGGFAGFEEEVNERNWQTNKCVLSGDIGASDMHEDNSFHIITSTPNFGGAFLLDGFTIENGNGFNPNGNFDFDGGAYYGFGTGVSFENCYFNNNNGRNGGAIFEFAGVVKIDDCTFENSYALQKGGAVYLTCEYYITNSTFINNNSGQFGGAGYHYNLGAGIIDKNKYFNNLAGSSGSALYFENTNINAKVTNSLFVENKNEYNAVAILCDQSELTIINSTIVANATSGSFIINSSLDHTPNIYNSTFWNFEDSPNSTSVVPFNFNVQNSNIYGGHSGTGNINEDPKFWNPFGIDSILGTQDDDFRLLSISPCIDQGLNSFLPAENETDLFGQDRIVATIEPMANVDIGALEYQGGNLGSVVYVDSSATGMNNGSSWADAFTDLQDALLFIDTSLNNQTLEIWIAKGTYYPTQTGDRNVSFVVPSLVSMYGGFSGLENSRGNRNFTVNEVVLSGEINDPQIHEDNSNIILKCTSEENALFIINGLSVKHGHAHTAPYKGSGINLLNGSLDVSNCVFEDCVASEGGAISAKFGEMFLDSCTFKNNIGFFGGAISIDSLSSEIRNCTFLSNEGESIGGAIVLRESDFKNLISNCIFNANYVGAVGGAIYAQAPINFLNTVFIGNSSKVGGGVFIRDKNHSFINCSFNNNTAQNFGGAIQNHISSQIIISNCIIWDNPSPNGDELAGNSYLIISPNIIKGYGESDIDPLFKNPLGLDSIAGTIDDNLRLNRNSPAIDKGSFPNNPSIEFDIDGNPRVVDYYAGGNIIDLGAYERPLLPGQDILFVDSAAIGENNGLTWPNAFNNLNNALVFNDTSAHPYKREIWIKKGTYFPTETMDRSASFEVGDSTTIYAGFFENTIERNNRNSILHPVILSGNIGNPDLVFDNSYTIIKIDSSSKDIELNELIIQEAFNEKIALGKGGGLYSQGQNVSLINCIIQNNFALKGAGAYHEGGSAQYIFCDLKNNYASQISGLYATDSAVINLSQVTIK